MTSPYYHHANGMAEAAVKQAKRIRKEAKTSGRDPHLALLDLRNTPQEGFSTSPAQRLMSRRTKTLPISESLLKPAVTEDTKQQRQARQERQKKFYNRGARDLPTLVAGDQVWIQPSQVGDREWKKATILKEAGIRSYEVETENERVLIRNRRHLKEAKKRPADVDDHHPIQELSKAKSPERVSGGLDGEIPEIPEPAVHTSTGPGMPFTAAKEEIVTRTRSGRISQKPRWLNDYYT